MPGTMPPRRLPPRGGRGGDHGSWTEVNSDPRRGRGQSNLSAMTQPAHRPRVLLSTSTVPRTTSLRRDDAMTGRNYSQAVALAGGLPGMVANLEPGLAEAHVAAADALLLTGGRDMDPGRFGAAPDRDLGSVDPERDPSDLARHAAVRDAGK